MKIIPSIFIPTDRSETPAVADTSPAIGWRNHPRIRRPFKYLNFVKALVVSRFVQSMPFVRFIPTDACNLSCSYCWQRRDDPFQMSRSDFNRYLSKARSYHVGMITFLGGEPMTWRYLYEGLAKCNEKHILTDLTTNGTALTQINILKLASAGLDFLNISVDGLRKNSVSQKNALIAKPDIIEHLHQAKRQYGMRFRMNAVIYNNNFDDIKSILEFSRLHKIPVSLGYIVPPVEGGMLGDPGKYFSLDDRDLLKEIVSYIIEKKRQGYPVIDPEAYFEGIFQFLERESFWQCNYPSRYGWINVTPRGELRSCTKKMDEVPGYTFETLNTQKIRIYKEQLRAQVDHCNKDCYSNCAFDAAYYRFNKIDAVKKMLGI